MSLFEPHTCYVGIVGSRRRDASTDYDKTLIAFAKIFDRLRGDIEVMIVSGGCPQGGDRFAELIADKFALRKIIHYPDRNAYPGTPMPFRATKQNYARNTLIAADSKDHLIACVAADRTGGTEDTIKKYVSIHRKEPILV